MVFMPYIAAASQLSTKWKKSTTYWNYNSLLLDLKIGMLCANRHGVRLPPSIDSDSAKPKLFRKKQNNPEEGVKWWSPVPTSARPDASTTRPQSCMSITHRADILKAGCIILAEAVCILSPILHPRLAQKFLSASKILLTPRVTTSIGPKLSGTQDWKPEIHVFSTESA